MRRRELLWGAGLGAGAALLSPMIRSLVSDAEGQSAPIKQVVFVLAGNGILSRIRPPELEDERGRAGDVIGGQRNAAFHDVPFTSLAATMTNLERYRDRLTILDDMSVGLGGGHYQGAPSMCALPNAGSGPGGETIDHFLGRHIGSDSPVPFLAVGAQGNEGRYARTVCATGRGRYHTIRCDPRDVYGMLFGPSDEASRIEFERNRSIMNFLREDVGRTRNALGGTERVKLDQYLHVLEGIEHRDQRIGETLASAANCDVPALEDNLSLSEGRQASMFELVGAALACRLTRVATIAINTGRKFDHLYEGLGYTKGLHGIGHGGSDPVHGGDAVIHNYHAGLIAGLCDRLAEVPQGDGTMLDHTLVVWHNENGRDHHSRPHHHWSLMLIGGSGGFLRPGGRYVRFPPQGSPGHRRVADLWTTLCHGAGVMVEHFQPDSVLALEGRIDALVA
ncbi:MAG: DUF1552 domain-containing protein [Myxococcota bacterium]